LPTALGVLALGLSDERVLLLALSLSVVKERFVAVVVADGLSDAYGMITPAGPQGVPAQPHERGVFLGL
jgi:hypothetical protein